MGSKVTQKRATMFNNNIKKIMFVRTYAKAPKKQDSVANTNPFVPSGDKRKDLEAIFEDQKDIVEQLLTKEEENRLEDLMQKTFDDVVKGLWVGDITRLPEDEVSPEQVAEVQKNLEKRVLEVAAKAPIQFMEFASTLIVDREKEKQIAARIDDPSWWAWDNPYIRNSFMRSIRNNYKELDKFLLKPGTGEIDGTRAAAMYEQAEQTGIDTFITPQDIVSTEAPETDFNKASRRRRECLLCSEVRHEFPLEPMNVPFLRRFMNTSGTILGRRQTGLCRKHQSKVQKTIKWAKHIGIFQYKEGFQVFNPSRTTTAEAEEIQIPEWMLAPK